MDRADRQKDSWDEGSEGKGMALSVAWDGGGHCQLDLLVPREQAFPSPRELCLLGGFRFVP